MKYKGYEAVVNFDEDTRIFHGEIIGLKDVITFQGSSVDELEKAFIDSVEDYLSWYGEEPKKRNIGSSFDDFLQDEGITEEINISAGLRHNLTVDN